MASSPSGQDKPIKSHIVIGNLSGQDGAILSAQDCPFCSHNNILPKSSGSTKFLFRKIFSDSKKIFCDFTIGMEQENEKTETCHYQCLKINKYEDHFFSVLYAI